MAETLNILSICGSLRKGSYNAALQRTLPSLAPPGLSIKPAPSFAGLALYNFDEHQASGIPALVNTFADAIRAAEAPLLASMPEGALMRSNRSGPDRAAPRLFRARGFLAPLRMRYRRS